MGYTDTINRVLAGNYDEASDEEKEEAVGKVVTVCSVASAAVAVQPIPFVDTALISPIQIAMVQAIARVHGHKLDTKSILEILSTFGASIVAQNVLMAAAKFIPFLGWVVAISMAYALTYAVGEVSHAYFKSGRGLSADAMKDLFRRTYEQKKKEKQEQNKSNASLKDKLTQLNQAREAGLLSDEEFAQKKEELLASF